jgi:Uma2 family endonuclease
VSDGVQTLICSYNIRMVTAPTLPFVPVEQYLKSSYEPDMEYVDGALLERNLGRKKHSRLQALVTILLARCEQQYATRVYVEQRIRVSERRYRIPDVCLMAVEHTADEVFVDAPLLIIEILSPDDNFGDLRRKLEDYRTMGVRNICIVDPYEKPTLFLVNDDGRLVESSSLEVSFVLRDAQPALTVDFGQLIAQLD